MKSKDQKIMSSITHISLVILTLAAILPFVLLIISSFTEDITAIKYGYSFFPKQWSLDAYRFILNQWGTIGKAYLITIIVTTVGTAVSIIMSALLGYSLSRKDLPGKNVLVFLTIFTMLFNGGLVATYITYTKIFHINDTIFALIVPNLLMNAFNVILVKSYFENNIPDSLYEAAKIDGAGEIAIFFKIMLPLAVPILATVGLIVGIMYWNDWQNGLYYLTQNKNLYSIQNILNAINQNAQFLAQTSTGSIDTSKMPTTTVRMAIAVVGVLPVLVVYPFFQKYFIKGITMGAVKG